MAGDGDRTPLAGFHRDGHVVVRGAVGGAAVRRGLTAARTEIARFCTEHPELAGPRRGRVEYLPITRLCTRSGALGALVRDPGLARLAAEALGVPRVRLLYDELFAKPTGSMPTIWHQDQTYWPIDSAAVVPDGAPGVVRFWVTLTDLPPEVGGLHFVDGSHRCGPIALRDVEVEAPGRATVATIAGRDHTITDYGALSAGDATLHAGHTLHGSRRNDSGRTRYGLAVAYIPDGTRIAEPTERYQELAIDFHAPGRRPGDLIDTSMNPVLWPVEAA